MSRNRKPSPGAKRRRRTGQGSSGTPRHRQRTQPQASDRLGDVTRALAKLTPTEMSVLTRTIHSGMRTVVKMRLSDALQLQTKASTQDSLLSSADLLLLGDDRVDLMNGLSRAMFDQLQPQYLQSNLFRLLQQQLERLASSSPR